MRAKVLFNLLKSGAQEDEVMAAFQALMSTHKACRISGTKLPYFRYGSWGELLVSLCLLLLLAISL